MHNIKERVSVDFLDNSNNVGKKKSSYLLPTKKLTLHNTKKNGSKVIKTHQSNLRSELPPSNIEFQKYFFTYFVEE